MAGRKSKIGINMNILMKLFRPVKKAKVLVINCEKLETRVALMNNGRLEEYQIERKEDKQFVNSVYLGKITHLENSLQAAFVDIGSEKNAFLHYKDMLPATYDMIEKVKSDGHRRQHPQGRKNPLGNFTKRFAELERKRRSSRIRVEDVPKLFTDGSEILVQVTKGPIGTKGPRVSTNISIPGRYLVLLPFSDHIGLSKKIEDPKERDRLRKIMNDLEIPDGMGCICRTVGEDRKDIFFKRDLDMLLELWQRVEHIQKNPKAPCIVYEEPSLILRTMRDFLTEEIDEIVVDDEQEYNYIKEFLAKIAGPEMIEKVTLYKKPTPVFESFGIEKQISEVFNRKIGLPSGGYICIDETEALISIDVNTGSTRGKAQPEIILKTNLEAANEIARQLRLRNIGGLVVIDFIDMDHARDRDAVYKQMRTLVRDDSAKTSMLPISKFGLMEMTRQREHESLSDAVYDACPYCHGGGKVKSALSMSVEIQRRLQEVLKKHKSERGLAIKVLMHPSILARLKNEDAAHLTEMESKHGKELSFRADPALHLEEFKLIDPETGVEYK